MTYKAIGLTCCTLLLALPVFGPGTLQAQNPGSGPDSATPAPKPAPDVLVFTNGDQLTGKLDHASGGSVIFKSDMAGTLTIPFSKIKELRSGSEFVALHKGKAGHETPAGTGSVTVADDKVTLSQGTQPAQTLATGDLAYLVDVPSYAKAVDHRAGFKQGWTGSATGGFTMVRSTEKATTFTAAVNFVRAIPTVPYLPDRNRTTINVTETYGVNSTPYIAQSNPPTPASTVQTSIFHGDGERDEYFSPRVYSLADVSFDHNFSQGLQFQYVAGGGVGWTIVESAKQEFDVRGDVHYEKQEFVPTSVGAVGPNGAFQDNLDLIGSTFTENYHRTLPRKLVFTEWANVLPAWNDRTAYTANAFVSFAMPVFKRLSATVSSTDNYLNNPSPGYRRNSVQFVTGLTYIIK